MKGTPFLPVIMAGGQGTRFWPLSTRDTPKQFLDLFGSGRTLLQQTFDRLLPLAGSVDALHVATTAAYAPLVRAQLPELPTANILLEPSARDSGPAVALASLLLHRRHGNVTLGFFSSDHHIGNRDAFHQAVRNATQLAHTHASLVTLGIAPTHAATSYGYIERGEAAEGAYRVARFVEKPNAERAQHYLDAGNFDWNAGIFVWQSETILNELHAHAPDIIAPLHAAADHELDAVFATLPRRSIDYAVMEHTQRALVVPVACDWDDVGDWLALARHLPSDGDGNTTVGWHVSMDARGNIVYSSDPTAVVATLGVNNLIVVAHQGQTLVLEQSRVAELRGLLDQLES